MVTKRRLRITGWRYNKEVERSFDLWVALFLWRWCHQLCCGVIGSLGARSLSRRGWEIGHWSCFNPWNGDGQKEGLVA